jgi:hypothetical protein
LRGRFSFQAVRIEGSPLQAAISVDDREVMGKIRMARAEKPIKVKPLAAGLKILIEGYYTAAHVKEGQRLIGGPKDNGLDAILILYAYLIHLMTSSNWSMQSSMM